MKKIFLILSFILLFLLTSCKAGDFQASDLVKAPQNVNPPLQGKWLAKRFIERPDKRGDVDLSQDLSKMEALFSEEAVKVGSNYSLNPLYKTRSVDTDDYLFYNYKIDREYLDIAEDKIDILTISGEDGYFSEFIKYGDDKIIFFDDDKFIFFERTVETVSSEEVLRYIDIEKSINISLNVGSSYTLNSGLLLGIKTEKRNEDTDLKEWVYETIWIRSGNRQILSAYKIEGLLLPRKRGFWYVDSKRQKINKNTRDIIVASQNKQSEEEKVSPRISPIEDFLSKSATAEYLSILKHILYIGNDYVSVEEINPATNRKNLRVYPVDYLEDENPTLLSDLVDLDEFYKSTNVNLKLEDGDILEDRSFGMDRKNGHWMLKARLNYIENKDELYKDFNINIIPPKEIVQYDELLVSWSLIKSRFPQAIDAFTSPNEDIILIVKRDMIDIHPIMDGDIGDEILASIEIDSNQKIVMAEWSRGKYVSSWEEEVLKNDVSEIQY